jgi:hypothetical protein
MDAGDKEKLTADFALDHLPGDQLTHMKSADEDALDDSLEVDRIVGKERAAFVAGGIAHQNVNLPNRFERLGHKFFATRPIENVRLDCSARSAQRVNFRGSLGKIGTSWTVVEDQIGSLTGQFERTALANSSTRTRDQCSLTGMPHAPSLQPSR